MIHEHENNQESQNHLDANLDKFKGDCRIVMQMLYSGLRLTARDLEKNYDIDGRRLRDVIKARPDVVKKEWVKQADGKTKYMEYYIEKIKPPTKSDLQIWWDAYQNEKPLTIPQQLSLYENQYRDA
jgi:hypothetical protein